VTTIFENVYLAGSREQRLLSVAGKIDLTLIPSEWRNPAVVLLGPVAGELPHDAATCFSAETLVGVGAQGFLRRREGDCVLPGRFEPRPAWLAGDVVFLSEEDIDEPERVGEWCSLVPIVVLTRGSRGCTLWNGAGRRDFPALATREVDLTCAGDVFATAF